MVDKSVESCKLVSWQLSTGLSNNWFEDSSSVDACVLLTFLTATGLAQSVKRLLLLLLLFLELLSTLLKWLLSLTKLVPNSVHSSLLFWTLKTPLVKFITTWFKPLLITTTFPIISNHWWKVFTLTSKPLSLQMNFALLLYLLVVVYSKVIA